MEGAKIAACWKSFAHRHHRRRAHMQMKARAHRDQTLSAQPLCRGYRHLAPYLARHAHVARRHSLTHAMPLRALWRLHIAALALLRLRLGLSEGRTSTNRAAAHMHRSLRRGRAAREGVSASPSCACARTGGRAPRTAHFLLPLYVIPSGTHCRSTLPARHAHHGRASTSFISTRTRHAAAAPAARARAARLSFYGALSPSAHGAGRIFAADLHARAFAALIEVMTREEKQQNMAAKTGWLAASWARSGERAGATAYYGTAAPRCASTRITRRYFRRARAA